MSKTVHTPNATKKLSSCGASAPASWPKGRKLDSKTRVVVPDWSRARWDAVRYDVWISKGCLEWQIMLDRDEPFAKDDIFSYGPDSYRVNGIQPGYDEFDAVVLTEWIGDVGIGTSLPPA